MSTSSGEKVMDSTEENSRLLQGAGAVNQENGYGSQSDAVVWLVFLHISYVFVSCFNNL